ncbi:glycosyltransferase family 2 protein [Candidatus Roizmanbacteria bacterium]|nr:glycosyltransferase family 2 protein [Candidatus Roizmanbacteria bacterium]
MNKPEFSLIIACYNEEENLQKTVEDSVKTLSSLFKAFEIIIIEDKSDDKSPQIAEKLARKYASVKVIHNSINLGQGISFLIGLEASIGDLVMQNGADRPFDIRDLKKIIGLFPQYDIVIVARINRAAYSFWRKFTSWGNIILRWLFFGFAFKDLNFIQIYKRGVISNVNVLSRSAAFVTQELVLRAKQKGYKIIEISLPYHKRIAGIAHHGKKRDILWALIDMINFWLEYRR